MMNQHSSSQFVEQARNLLRDMGYRESLLLPDYSFSDLLGQSDTVQTIALAAHAQEPVSYRTACLGIAHASSDAGASEAQNEIARYRALGAPLILAQHPHQRCALWRMTSQGPVGKIEEFATANLPDRMAHWESQWQPETILRAKNAGGNARALDGPAQLDLFDVGLIPAIEAIVYQKLNDLLQRVVQRCQEVYQDRHDQEPDGRALFRLIFRLVAAKVLGDRKYPGEWLVSDTSHVLAQVNDFYFRDAAAEPVALDVPTRNTAWDMIRGAFHFQNLSVEALAYVYENTFVDKYVRQELGTHATPREIAEFAVRCLPIDMLAQDQRMVFEPFCGAAPFLVAARSRLREDVPEEWDAPRRHNYFKMMLSGMEVDPFAREVALYSLILADYPNPNGWNILEADAFESPHFDAHLQAANIVLCNPPYGKLSEDAPQGRSARREVEALRRVMEHPPQMLAFVLPRTYVNGRSYKDVRQKIEDTYGSVDTVSLPDTVFHHSAQETTLLLAYGPKQGHVKKRSVSLTKEQYQRFRHTRSIDWKQSSLETVWEELTDCPRLGSVAEIHRGVEHAGFRASDPRFVSATEKQGFVAGLADARDIQPYIVGSPVYLNAQLPFRRGTSEGWNKPKVIVPAARKSTGVWKTTATLDYDGLVCTQRFHGIWRKEVLGAPPLEVLAAILNGPVANAWLAAKAWGRDIQLNCVKDVPLPHLSAISTDLITRYVDRYISHGGNRETLLLIDAAVLDAYGLSDVAEKVLLASFNGARRPGVPGFGGYETDFEHAQIAYRHDLAMAQIGEQHQALVEKSFLGRLTPQETQEKERLRREIDEDSAPFYEDVLRKLASGR